MRSDALYSLQSIHEYMNYIACTLYMILLRWDVFDNDHTRRNYSDFERPLGTQMYGAYYIII